jgi:streptomycin 6-kinase
MASDLWRKTIESDGEALSGDVLEAFGGRGMVRLCGREPGVLLLERLDPGTPLATVVLNGDDEEATRILARTIAAMIPGSAPPGVPTAAAWGAAFDWYLASGDCRIPADLVDRARRVYISLCDSQSDVRLLHGDLHHDNILFDTTRGWVAIDPKGIIGELAYEVGAALRNPHTAPGLYANPAIIERRVDCFTRELHLDRTRVLGWAFSQAVLAAIWTIEDGLGREPRETWIALAGTMRSMLEA